MSEIRTKHSMVIHYVHAGDYKKALAICKNWRLPISPEDSDTLRRGYECMTYPRLYESIGYEPQEEINKAVEILKRIYL